TGLVRSTWGVLHAATQDWGGSVMAIDAKERQGLGLRTIVLGCLLAGPIAFLVLSQSSHADQPSAPGGRGQETRAQHASPTPRLPRDNLLLFRGQDNSSTPVRSVEDWLKRR